MLALVNNVRRSLSILAITFALLIMQGCASYTKWKVDAVEPSRKGVAPQSISINSFSDIRHREGLVFARLLSGKLQDENFVEIRNRGGEGRLSGALNWGKTERDRWVDKYEYKGETHRTYYSQIKKSLTVSYQLELAGRTYSATYEKKFAEKESSSEGYSKAKAELPSEEAIRAKLMRKAAYEIVKDITPYNVKKTYKIKLGETDKLALGADYLEIERQDQAKEIFRQISEKTKNTEDRAAAIYNLGVIHEANGEFEQAFKAYRDASQMNLEELMYPKAITRLEKEVERRERLNKQMESLKR